MRVVVGTGSSNKYQVSNSVFLDACCGTHWTGSVYCCNRNGMMCIGTAHPAGLQWAPVQLNDISTP
jgi:hypothetical protein